MPDLFRRSYAETLAHHHTWIVRKSVSLASHMLPDRSALLARIFEAVADESQHERAARDFSSTIGLVYARVQKIYADYKLLNLP